jgi:outer membrane translocation and assembly module TamA
LGQNNSKEDRANYRFQQTYLEGFAELRPLRWLPIRGTVGYEHWSIKSGKGDEPSIETVYTPQTAPGLGASPSYVHSQFSVGIDWRQSPGYSTRGGLYQATLHDYNNTGSGAYSFQRFDAEVVQYLPLYRETWVLAARGKMQTTLNNNDLIPYFLLPTLGSGDTLRAYATDRFHDRHSLLFNLEFRWLPARALDMALFYDCGKVASRRSDLDFSNMKSDVGIGARIHGPMATPLRVDLAVGNEGWRIVFSGGPVF